ncbi:type II toxin-antitoxin system VapC family toxin [Larkinella rosea]|uniref:Type II toxin-antitoxin system VapC family toxin n=1 Tax=Larkinella rosea TaxID=2025312 RepID=A0A3P1BT53_9BACT|nr:type II toxin-antitoxin system VapC family toxin [Larkinella rosea]RRB04036.1 type II toxin-antitoxin system VapC family toxin [Larkinella rosea]
MRLLLDTHALLWVLEADPQLSHKAHQLIRNTANEVSVSAVSLFEIAIKTKLGKLETQRTATEIIREMQRLAIQLLPIARSHLDAYQLVPLLNEHRDPFDRLLIATAYAEGLDLISIDSKFTYYSDLVNVVW